MADNTWTCPLCGADDNTGAFCLKCGASKTGLMGIDIFGAPRVPDDHGPLISFLWSSSRSGMMMYSGQNWDREMIWEDDGTVTLTDRYKEEGDHSTVKTYRPDPAEAEKLRSAVTADVIAWSSYKYDYEKETMFATDVSTSDGFTLRFAPAQAGGKESYCSIDIDAVGQNGKREEAGKLKELLLGLIRDENMVSEEAEELRLPNGMTKKEYLDSFSTRRVAPVDLQPDADQWTCPECGAVNSGKFCAECGTPRPV